MKDRPIATLSQEDKAEAYKAIKPKLEALEREHGASLVRWVFNRLRNHRAELKAIEREKADLEKRLAELR